ncbi:MAG: hypothetical protein ACON49_10195 [Candidatus Puniceispirillaceae bacterium]
MLKTIKNVCLSFALLTVLSQPSLAFEEISYEEVMAILESVNPDLHKQAEHVYLYSTTNVSDIIKKPLLTRHSRNMNGFIDRKNRVSAKYFGVGTDGLKSKLLMYFRFNGKKYKVTEHYAKTSKFGSWNRVE